MEVITEVFDLFLTDFKYGNDRCAQKLSIIDNYWATVSSNHETVLKKGSVIVRHLVLPGHHQCCTVPVMDFLSTFKKVPVNVMDQYRPQYRAKNMSGINRQLTNDEYKKAVSYALSCGLEVIEH